MSDAAHMVEVDLLIDSYGRESALVRLAELASPACRIEPQLLRHLRLACVPDADVSVEQELWHSELVNSRGTTITFRSEVTHALRQRLRARNQAAPPQISNAHEIMKSLHAELSPLLILEDELGWAEVLGDDQAMRTGAQDLLKSLLAHREGVDHWLGRAWSSLPAKLKSSAAGRDLAQVAAAQGAPVEAGGQQEAGGSVAHILPLVSLPLRLHGNRLEINVPPPEATHTIDVPRTQPRALAVTWKGGSRRLVFSPDEMRDITFPKSGIVVLRTLAGAEYQIEVGGAQSPLEIEMVAAGQGASLILSYGVDSSVRQVVVDCGDRRVAELTLERLLDAKKVELLVLTHIDNDRIGGAEKFLEQVGKKGIGDVWFNGLKMPRRLATSKKR
jgi:hypothetical protein